MENSKVITKSWDLRIYLSHSIADDFRIIRSRSAPNESDPDIINCMINVMYDHIYRKKNSVKLFKPEETKSKPIRFRLRYDYVQYLRLKRFKTDFEKDDCSMLKLLIQNYKILLESIE